MKPLLRGVMACLVGMILFSCDSLRNEVDPDRLNQTPRKLVVAGFISPQDTVLAIQVNESVPVLGESTTIRDVTDAQVTISSEGRFVVLRYASNYNKQGINLYWASTKNFAISTGKTYDLTVETPRGQKVTARCTIPVSAPTPILQLDSAVVSAGIWYGAAGQQESYTKEYTVRVRWTDLPGGRNYYRVLGLFQSQLTTPANATAVSPIITQNITFGDAFSRSSLLTDSPVTDGKSLTSRQKAYFLPLPGPASPGTPPDQQTPVSPATAEQLQLGRLLRFGELRISLLHTDELYYRYHDAISRQQDADGNPFSEPVQIPTNIQGGLGCFSGYDRNTVTVRVR